MSDPNSKTPPQQWWKHGDHPAVRNRLPGVPGDTRCGYCGDRAHTHGWLDTPDGGYGVCPGDWVVPDGQGGYRRLKPEECGAAPRPGVA